MRGKFYITTPIYYPSDRLHIGHAYTTVAADTVARFKRMEGYDVFFLTGADEHGQKIERTAKSKGKDPQSYVDEIVASFKELWARLEISYDDFIRTTEPRHKVVAQKIFQKLYEQGDIYKSTYQGWYCTPCETFWTARQLVDGKCPDCGRPVELLQEESYFFRLSAYADRLLAYIEEHPDFIQPPARRNEVISFIRGGLEDLCVSRTTFSWGIPVPFDPRHVIYVWIDALTNYLSALGYGTEDDERFKRYWPADVHLVGKDIVRFHAIIWPSILMALGLELPRRVVGHGWLLVEGGKMSKSKGNVIDPHYLIDKYGVDAVRYYLLRELAFGADGEYEEKNLVKRLNYDLANDLGNLLYRTLTVLEKYGEGVIGEPVEKEGPDDELIALAISTPARVAELVDQLQLSEALAAIWQLVGRANKYLDETAPWRLGKDPGRKKRFDTVIYNVLEVYRFITVLLGPFMPGFPPRVWPQLGIASLPALHTFESLKWGQLPPGIRVAKGEPLFPRLELED
ncbi:methionyl-tRNA synthetase [Ammonifex degensii KC4]|uniref:Methionine--tRNA ligase n=1 Tax=Ammonifex degensii (strain DSM 10501 / KC4) TaxID=429009 RepID=C9RA63_AMMDK|nr:methionyl-tRNA synthetase [Ammonifex degensii KC4]